MGCRNVYLSFESCVCNIFVWNRLGFRLGYHGDLGARLFGFVIVVPRLLCGMMGWELQMRLAGGEKRL